jgi:hypothetical protein
MKRKELRQFLHVDHGTIEGTPVEKEGRNWA